MIIQPDFLDHWKTNALAARIGRLEAITALLALWSHCQQRRAWQFQLTPLMLAGICRYPSENPGVLMDTLIELNLLEKTSDGAFIVHDWAETNAALVHNWTAGKQGGRPRKQPQDKPKENPRDNPAQTPGKPEGKPIREEKRREEEKPPVVPQGGQAPGSSSTSDSEPPAQTGGPGLQGKKKKGGGAARMTEPTFPEDLPQGYHGPLTEWFGYKRQVGKGYVPDGWAKLITQQRRFTVAQVAASVEASMANGWAGLFTDRVQAEQQKKGGAAAAPKKPDLEEPAWDWRAAYLAKWGVPAPAGERWQHLPASYRYELQQWHEQQGGDPS